MYFQVYLISCNLPQIPKNFGLTWVFPYLMTMISYRDMSRHMKKALFLRSNGEEIFSRQGSCSQQ